MSKTKEMNGVIYEWRTIRLQMKSGDIVEMETWCHPDYSKKGPNEFIPSIHKTREEFLAIAGVGVKSFPGGERE
jgi:hypothetical protein